MQTMGAPLSVSPKRTLQPKPTRTDNPAPLIPGPTSFSTALSYKHILIIPYSSRFLPTPPIPLGLCLFFYYGTTPPPPLSPDRRRLIVLSFNTGPKSLKDTSLGT